LTNNLKYDSIESIEVMIIGQEDILRGIRFFESFYDQI
jgi:hypothetical protein